MTVTTKPKPQQPDESQVQKLINKGGSVATGQGRSDAPEFFSVLLRLPVDMLTEIDERVKQRRPVRISRQAWIIEALHERLTKDTK